MRFWNIQGRKPQGHREDSCLQERVTLAQAPPQGHVQEGSACFSQSSGKTTLGLVYVFLVPSVVKLGFLMWDLACFFMSAFAAINCPHRIALLASHKFWHVVLSFLFVLSIFWFPLWLLWFTGCLKACCLASTILGISQFSSFIIQLWSESYLEPYLPFQIYWD